VETRPAAENKRSVESVLSIESRPLEIPEELSPPELPNREEFQMPPKEPSFDEDVHLAMPPREEMTATVPHDSTLSFDEPKLERQFSEVPREDEPRTGVDQSVFLKVLFIALVFHAGLSLFFYSFPPVATSVLGSIPWLGRPIVQSDRLREQVALDSLRATFETLKDNKKALVISGVATNRALHSLGDVEIEGRIFDLEGTELSHEVVSGGNALSLKILRDLTSKDISLLQGQKARRQFEIPPKESTEFVIVFLNPKRNVAKFQARVASARSSV
jgi:hypothetical protein